jgi:hypothetical protein
MFQDPKCCCDVTGFAMHRSNHRIAAIVYEHIIVHSNEKSVAKDAHIVSCS